MPFASIAGAVGLGLVDSLIGSEITKSNAREGGRIDLGNQKQMFDYRINRGLESGMTPYEMYMGPAAGAGGGTNNIGSTLGNQAGERWNANKALALDVWKTEKQTDTQKEVAKIQSSATQAAAETNASAAMYSADVQRDVAANRLKLDTKRYNNIDLPQASTNLEISKEQLKKVINEVATSDKEFVIYMQKLKMGVENMIVEYVQGMKHFDITKPETYPADPEERKQLLGFLMAVSSGTLKNVEGLKELFGQAQESLMPREFGNGLNQTLGRPWSKKMYLPPHKQRRPAQ